MLTRRHLLKTIVIAAGTTSAASLLSGCVIGKDKTKGGIRPNTEIFPQSLASGDPRPDGIVLWTRVQAPGMDDQDVMLRVDVSKTPEFREGRLVVSENIIARADHDHCVKVRLTQLQPSTTYYYRFVYNKEDCTVTGRTRTAPSPTADTEVRFAFVSCQDFIDRYYNGYLTIADRDDLDFVCFLGDYVYETTGDPQYQNPDSTRKNDFSNRSEAQPILAPQTNQYYYAALSLGNYRDLYKTVKSDPLLRKIHERFAFINVWDDHEFSDDYRQDVATYYDGSIDESNPTRKRNAEQAYFEYIPIDQDSVAGYVSSNEGIFEVAASQLYPDSRVYRDFKFGKHLQLFTTDFRTFRPDHLIC